MTEYASVDDLLAGDEIGQEDVTLPNGKVVTVKGLSAFERKLLYKGEAVDGDGNVDISIVETRLLRYGFVTPALTIGQAEAWTKVARADSVDVALKKIRDLSGMGEGADKSKV